MHRLQGLSGGYEWNDLRDEIGVNVGVYDNPPDLTENSWTLMRFTEVEEDGNLEWLIRKDGCMHCADPGCLKACPALGAIVQYSNGIVDFISENCIGCGYCIKGCPFNIPRISKKDQKAYKCTLCSDRVSVGLEPACAKACPTQAISFGTKKDMVEFAQTRITDLNERGYDKAGLYDPPGVDGAHVMYVLQHADRPERMQACPRIQRSAGWSRCGRGWPNRSPCSGSGSPPCSGSFITSPPARTRSRRPTKSKPSRRSSGQVMTETADDRAQTRYGQSLYAGSARQSLAERDHPDPPRLERDVAFSPSAVFS
jgi:formate dehydrogenase beta subunit